ncbi:MAG: Gfo/Idh/MocA family oxidoreductase [Armatimonadota bacterium]|nr:Gfo/Idh/MocA family oxidoreductase [Armatimonadota bacterium]MCX7777503.1 Gfo/Idh/MocA family oxidoreductase [Armatimonadota bacterium]MDW8025979.1 Gfo/Idh/MocA family oxidoreductase [Armatimonadota bacterium]
MTNKLRVAIIGARGIGKHHAKWYALCGCEVVAFVGVSRERLNETAGALRRLFGFDGRAYTDCVEMLRNERPEAVSICTPHSLHYEHTMLALSYGAHVMCEKPVVWDEKLSHNELLLMARRMAEEAKARNLLLAVNTQYAAFAERLREFFADLRGEWSTPKSFEMHMEAKSIGRDETGLGLWMDLSAHPISVLLRLFPTHELDESSFDVLEINGCIRVRFKLRCYSVDTEPIECQLTLRRIGEGESIQRFVRLNGLIVTISGRDDERGIYRSCLTSFGTERIYEDFMHTSIRKFVEAIKGVGEPLCTADEGIKNLEWQLKISRLIFGVDAL